ncbi:MAG: RNA polymerase sigma factor [Saprospiraceae bacterium]
MHTKQLDEILTKCKANDRTAQYKLYNLYSMAMYNVCLRMMKETAQAEDALQMAFVKAFKNINSFKVESTFGAWLKKIVINTCLSELNKKKMHFEDWDGKDFVEEKIDEPDVTYEVKMVKYAMSILPNGYRVIFSMYAVEGFDHMEIAQIMGISVGTSKSQYSRAKVRIKEILKDQANSFKISNNS